MKHNYLNLKSLKGRFGSIIVPITLMLFVTPIRAQQSYTFTNCGQVGRTGPSQAQANAAYLTTNLNGLVTVSAGVQSFTVPTTGAYRIEARGASGGTQLWSPIYPGGRGASMAGDFTLTAGTVLNIIVGQMGGDTQGTPQDNAAGGGGGGSYVYTLATSALPLVAAGGGGGGGRNQTAPPNASTLTSGIAAVTGGLGGVAGNGGQNNAGGSSYWAGGGAGWLTDGTGGNNGTNYAFAAGSSGAQGGRTPANGALGGIRWNDGLDEGGDGGFGGGGGGGSDNMGTGGGGGFSGGGGARYGVSPQENATGGGGGSYNGGINQLNAIATSTGHGRVIITQLCDVMVHAISGNSVNPVICSGTSITFTTNALTYTWSTGNTTTNSITVSPTVTTTYSVAGTGNISACQGAALITVTVSPGAPVLTVTTTTTQVCLGQSVVFTASGALTYTWTNGISNSVAFQPSATAVYTVSGENGCGITTATTAITIAPLPVSVVGPTSPICAGSISTLVASSAATSFTWLPTNASSPTLIASPASTTVYTVTASNGTCIGVSNYTVTTIPLPTVTAVASTTSICDGESVVLTASGGLNYNWTPGNLSGSSITVTPNSPIQYSVSGSNAQGCDAGATAVIIVFPSPNMVLSTNDPLICNGGSATLNVSGATNYTWSNNSNANSIVVNPTQSTVYSVIGLNNTNTCTSTSTISIDVFTPLVTIAGNTAICSGATTTLVASGANSYTWSNGVQFSNITVSPTANTVYTLSAISASNTLNCPSTTTIEVTIKANPAVVAVSDRPEICKSETVVVNASGANTYLWNTSATTSSISVTSTLVTTVILNVTGTGANGCTNTATVSVKINACNGVSEFNGNTNLVVYPNPATSEVNVSFDSEIELMVISQTGQLVKVIKLEEANGYKANLSGLSNGVYFITGQKGTTRLNEKLIILK